LVETVKNRILNFALELESEDPKAGEGFGKPEKLSDRQISQIFNTYISGTVGNVATGSSNFSQQSKVSITQGNLDQLIEYLERNGLPKADTKELELAIKADGDIPSTQTSFGKKVSSWVGKMITKAASGAWEVGTTAAATVLTEGLKHYYGIKG